mmetsp:Transcript_43548/g.83098  ORF Transcript_43548/g.83098 Transcript_43548/m.83098 type:complete len:316 (+) Transcript_43548:82-1029(+)
MAPRCTFALRVILVLIHGQFLNAYSGPVLAAFFARVVHQEGEREVSLRVWHDPVANITREQYDSGETVWFRYTANEQVRWNTHRTECLVQALEDAPREALLDSRGVALWEHVPSQEATPNGTADSLAADVAAPCQMWRAPRVSLQGDRIREYCLRAPEGEAARGAGPEAVLPVKQTLFLEEEGSRAATWTRTYHDVHWMEHPGKMLDTPPACRTKPARSAMTPASLATTRKLMKHTFQVEPRLQLHVPYVRLPLWQGKFETVQRNRAQEIGRAQSARLAKARNTLVKTRGTCDVDIPIYDCPLVHESWAAIKGRK